MLRGLGLWIVLEVMIGGVKFKAKEGIQRPWTASLQSIIVQGKQAVPDVIRDLVVHLSPAPQGPRPCDGPCVGLDGRVLHPRGRSREERRKRCQLHGEPRPPLPAAPLKPRSTAAFLGRVFISASGFRAGWGALGWTLLSF